MTQPVNWRELSGRGENTPPGLQPQSRSAGDLQRNSYRRSMYEGLATRAVVNDDGTQINDRVETLLTELVASCHRIEGLLQTMKDARG